MYLGQWSRGKEDGWGAHFCPRIAPTRHNPRARQALFVGTFRSGCPLEGLLVECEDASNLCAEDFHIGSSAWPAGAGNTASAPSVCSRSVAGNSIEGRSLKSSMKQTDSFTDGGTYDSTGDAEEEEVPTDWQALQARNVRAYSVCYDGSAAFWQSPVPCKQSGLFDMRVKLCEQEAESWDRRLDAPKSLQKWWYSWSPKPLPETTEKASAPGPIDGSPAEPAPKVLLSIETFESFLFLGLCVRNRDGEFPCPKQGVLKMLPPIGPGTLGTLGVYAANPELLEFEASFDGRVGLADNPSPLDLHGVKEFEIPRNVTNSYQLSGCLYLRKYSGSFH